MKNSILLKKQILIEGVLDNNWEYLSMKLLESFGVVIDKPNKLNHIHVKLISEFFGINIPSSFYSNPQDMKYFSCEELLIEQIVSYLRVEASEGNPKDFDRIEIFKKALPNYEEGREVVFRDFKIVSKQEADLILEEYAVNLSNYSRPWSLEEDKEFDWMYENGYYKGTKINSKDNLVSMFIKYNTVEFAKQLDQKDVVKISIKIKGESKQLSFTEEEKEILRIAITNCYENLNISKKQAKYFNTLRKHLKVSLPKLDNKLSISRMASEMVREGNVVSAAKLFAENGSMLERNLSWLLSRADMYEAKEIVDLIKVNNPLVSIQFVNSLLGNQDANRIFTFYKNNKVKKHFETEYEARWRKSRLPEKYYPLLEETVNLKVDEYYKSKPSLGKVYIDDAFKKIALPLNTSASGSGLGVLPTGSRLPIKGDYIRTFTYWNGPRDIDTSVSFIMDGELSGQPLYWGNYYTKPFGASALTSGDDRSSNGAEYIDFKISELKELGYTHALYSLNGYGDNFNLGEIFTGYQNKDNLDTQTWSPKNIETKIQVKGDSRSFLAFAIDFNTNEIIILNQMMESDNRVVTLEDYRSIKQYLETSYTDVFNIYRIASLRGEQVESIKDADIVFADKVEGLLENQKQIRTFDVDKLVSLL